MRYCNGAIIRGPQVGDRLMKKPFFCIDNLDGPIPCTVIYVNEDHGFYTVQFDAGYREAFQFGG